MAKVTPNILLPFEGKWVAITADRKKVVAHAPNPKLLDKKIKGLKKGENVIMTKVLPFAGSYSP